MRKSFSKTTLGATLGLALAFTFSCSGGTIEYGSLSYEGQAYKTIKIGEQTWMAGNLNYNASGSKCYNNNVTNCKKYGRLYNWATAKKACPKEWHLPSYAEWEALRSKVKSDKDCDNCDARHLKAKSGWNQSGNGTDAYGFSALPSGGYSNGDFDLVGSDGFWWSASDDDTITAYILGIYHNDNAVNLGGDNKSNLFSVRCLKD
jgi:uncharacterized protein (TIGR02145 family)